MYVGQGLNKISSLNKWTFFLFFWYMNPNLLEYERPLMYSISIGYHARGMAEKANFRMSGVILEGHNSSKNPIKILIGNHHRYVSGDNLPDIYFITRLYIVACQAHPALVKIGPAVVPLFIFDSPLARIHVLDYKSVSVSCLVYVGQD